MCHILELFLRKLRSFYFLLINVFFIGFYRITLTVSEPYRREYSDRNSLKYRELSGNLTHALENLFDRHIPGYKHLVNVVKIS